MSALLIVSGAFMFVLGWLWVAIAARKLPIARFILALLAAPLTLLLRGRGYARAPRLLMVVGLLLTLAGAALLQREQPERFAQLLAGEWVSGSDAGIGIQGQLMGQPFKPERVLWRGSELVFEEGPPERIRRSLAIRFGQATALLTTASIDRLPGDAGPWPELLLQWHTGALSQPGLLRVTDDYTLGLEFVPLAGQGTRVALRLHLPTSPPTMLNGEAMLAGIPQWLQQLQEPAPAPMPAPAQTAPDSRSQTPEASQGRPQWQDVSVLAVLDEPAFFTGQQIRLTTQAGRRYEGRLKAISEDRRLVLAQNSGANQVDYHFRPADVIELQVFYRSSR